MYLIKMAFFNALKFFAGIATTNMMSVVGSLYLATDEDYVKLTDLATSWLDIFKKSFLSAIFVGVMK